MSQNKIKHIAIAGNIGAGKTTLAEKLSQHFDWDVFYEDVTFNPYLSDFYENMHRWSFNLQVYFLNSRFNQIIQIQNGHRTVIQDRTIYEDAHIFAPNLYELGLMSQRDFENYTNLFRTISSLFTPPDLLIYLRGSVETLLKQIKNRGREYEINIRPDYLKSLNDNYENWINNYKEGKLLIIDIENYDLINSPNDFIKITELIQNALNNANNTLP